MICSFLYVIVALRSASVTIQSVFFEPFEGLAG
jgi:hypothetical protein